MARLIVESGLDKVADENVRQNGSYELVKDSTLIGRAEVADLRVTDSHASREHCRILREERGESGVQYVLQELGSTNGTEVDGARVTVHYLVDGNRIAIGKMLLRFEEADAGAQPPSLERPGEATTAERSEGTQRG